MKNIPNIGSDSISAPSPQSGRGRSGSNAVAGSAGAGEGRAETFPHVINICSVDAAAQQLVNRRRGVSAADQQVPSGSRSGNVNANGGD